MLVSVIIPLYNKEARISLTLASVLCQEGDFEVIVVDDGSTDKSAAVVDGIADCRIRYFYQPNAGPSSARNRGVKEAKGEWIVFLDADDEFLPDAFGHFRSLIESNPDIKVFTCNFYLKSDNNLVLYSRYYKEGVLKNNFRAWFTHRLMPCQGSTIYKRELFAKDKFNEAVRRYEDAGLVLNIMRDNRWYTSKQPVFIYCTDYSAASKKRPSIKEDFCGYISFEGKPFWEQVSLYDFYSMAYDLYPEEAAELYDNIKVRWNVKMVNIMYRTALKCFSLLKQIVNQIVKNND